MAILNAKLRAKWHALPSSPGVRRAPWRALCRVQDGSGTSGDRDAALPGGVRMPRIGFGTAGLTAGTAQAVEWALAAGYRLLDSAQVRPIRQSRSHSHSICSSSSRMYFGGLGRRINHVTMPGGILNRMQSGCRADIERTWGGCRADIERMQS